MDRDQHPACHVQNLLAQRLNHPSKNKVRHQRPQSLQHSLVVRVLFRRRQRSDQQRLQPRVQLPACWMDRPQRILAHRSQPRGVYRCQHLRQA